MAFAAAIGPIISGIASLAGAAVSASAMNSQADAEEQIAAYNAEQQRREAAWAQARGAQEAGQREKEGERKSATARAAQAQGGVATTEGSPLLLQQEFAVETMFSSNVAMANATKEQRTLEDKAKITLYEGQVRANASRAQATAGLISGVAGAVKGIGGAFG